MTGVMGGEAMAHCPMADKGVVVVLILLTHSRNFGGTTDKGQNFQLRQCMLFADILNQVAISSKQATLVEGQMLWKLLF